MTKHTLSILVENEAGILSQVSRLFARKGYNIDSLAVGVTEDPTISRITTVISGDELAAKQIANQLNKLVSVLSVKILPPENMVTRELALIKIRANGRDERDEIIQIVNVFRAKTVDMARGSMMIEATGNEDKINALIDLLSSFEIMEITRTGTISLERGQNTIYDLNKERKEYNYGKNVL